MELWSAILGLPIASGVNLYATVLVLGLSQRFGWIRGLPEELEILSNPILLGIAGVCYLLEFFADKIPYLDTLWDGLHTFIRPVGAAFLSVGAAAQYGPAAQVLAMLIGASLGLGAHSAKAGTRMLVNTSPEPASNILVSLAEDLGVVGLVVLIFTHPWLALGAVLLLVAAMVWVTPLLYRTVRFSLAGLAGFLANSLGSGTTSPPPLPDWLSRQLSGAPSAEDTRIYPCFARSVPGVPLLQRGYLILTPEGAQFAFRRLLRNRTVALANGGPPDLSVQRRALWDVYFLGVSEKRPVRFCVAKNYRVNPAGGVYRARRKVNERGVCRETAAVFGPPPE